LRKDVIRNSQQIVGSLLLAPIASGLAELMKIPLWPLPPGSSGGSLGVWLVDWLGGRFTHWLIFAAVALLGLGLVSHWLLGRIGKWSWLALRAKAGVFVKFVRWLVRVLHKPQPAITRIGEVPRVPEEIRREPLFLKRAKNKADIPIRHHAKAVVPTEPMAGVGREATIEAFVPIERPKLPSEEERFANYELPPISLLEEPEPFPYEEQDEHLRQQAALLEKTFADFDLNVRVVGINTGPVITQYEVALETGLRVNKITVMSDDLALNLKVPAVRIVAPIPGKNTVGIEIP
jgi:S-DNA-T family DNA segregation ATPase FtsK/SpoIIIE